MKLDTTLFAKISARFGILICLGSALAGFFGVRILGFRPLSFYVVGMSLIVLACWVKLDQK